MWVNEQLLNNTLNVFERAGEAITSEQAGIQFAEQIGEAAPSNGINSAIAALEKGGYLVKAGKVEKLTNSDSAKYRKVSVNTWTVAKVGPVDMSLVKSPSVAHSVKADEADFNRLHHALSTLSDLLRKGNTDVEFLGSYIVDAQEAANRLQGTK